MSKGLIILGYQGIGKTTLANNAVDKHIIDFESSLLKINNVRPENWYQIYVAQAISLAQQGYTVFLSSHKDVKDTLVYAYDPKEITIVTIAPSYTLKSEWIDKLQNRYNNDPSDKNYAALKNAEEGFVDQVTELSFESECSSIVIYSMDYDLDNIVSSLQNIYIG